MKINLNLNNPLQEVAEKLTRKAISLKNLEESKSAIEKDFLEKQHFDISKVLTEVEAEEDRDSESIKYDEKKMATSQKTGSLITRYGFITCLFFQDEYIRLIKEHKFKDKLVPLSKINELIIYRSDLDRQIKKQYVRISEINEQIKITFTEYYDATEEKILEQHKKRNPSTFEKSVPSEWFPFLVDTVQTYNLIKRGITSEKITKTEMLEVITKNTWLKDSFKVEITEKILNLCRKRDKYLLQAHKIAAQVYAIDILAEDRRSGKKPRAINWVIKQMLEDVLPDPKSIADEFCNRPENKSGVHRQAVEEVMVKTRDYIVKNSDTIITNLESVSDGAIEGTLYRLLNKMEKSIPSTDGSRNTRKSWITFYAHKAGLTVTAEDLNYEDAK